MKIKALKGFTMRDAQTGDLVSIGHGEIVTMDDTLAGGLIEDGLAEAYTLISPTGKLTITGTAEVDCAAYASAQVVDENLVAGNIKKDVTILGVTGTLE